MPDSPLLKALRADVWDQTIAVRRAHCPGFCCLCLSPVTDSSDSHVDHWGQHEFKDIVRAFLATTKDPALTKRQTRGIKIWTLAEPDVRAAWQDFHRSRAKLRLICASCNIRKDGATRLQRNALDL